MLFPSCQTVKIKWLDELAFVLSYATVLNLNKIALSGVWFSFPVSFVGWQTLSSAVVLIILLIHPRIRNEVEILDKSTLVLILPVSVSYTIVTAVAGIATSSLAIPVLIAWFNVCPAILCFSTRKNKRIGSTAFFSCLVICLSAVSIFFIDSTEDNKQYYLCLLIHVGVNLTQSWYLKRVNLQISDVTKIFYNNSVCLIALLPVSIYYATEERIELDAFLFSFTAGFFHLALLLFTFCVKSKNTRFFTIQAGAQLIAMLINMLFFSFDFSPWVWCFVIVSWFTTGFILNLFSEDVNKNSRFILVVPQVSKNLYVEKYINYNDMA